MAKTKQEPEIPRVLMTQENYDRLIATLAEQRADLVQLVSVFQSITALFSGKSSAMAMIPTIMKLINDPQQLEAFKHIIPIVEKYTPKPVNDASNEEK